MKDNIVKIVISVFIVMLVVLAVVASSAIVNISRSMASSDWVNHTHAVIQAADAIITSMHSGETSLRNYLITGDKRDQALYRDAYGEMVEYLEVGKALTSNEPLQQRKFIFIEGMISNRISFSRELVLDMEKSGLDAARKKLQTDVGSTMLYDIQKAVKKLKFEQNALLRERDKDSYLQAQATRWTVISGVVLNFLFLAFVGWLIRDDIAARKRAATALGEANAMLEQKVKERTAELVTANESLKKENLERRWSAQAVAHQLHYSDLIINSISDHIFVISKVFNISRVNPVVAHTTGFDLPEMVGSPMDKVLRIQDVPGASARELTLQQALKEGREIQGRPGTLLCKNGTSFPMRFNMVPLRDQNKVVGGVLTVRLCTETKQEPG